METWQQIRNRHKAEKIGIVKRLADQGLTQTEASRQLKVSLTCLNNFIIRERIDWPVKMQGRRNKSIKCVIMAQEGYTREQVREVLNLSHAAIREYTRNYAIEWRE